MEELFYLFPAYIQTHSQQTGGSSCLSGTPPQDGKFPIQTKEIFFLSYAHIELGRMWPLTDVLTSWHQIKNSLHHGNNMTPLGTSKMRQISEQNGSEGIGSL